MVNDWCGHAGEYRVTAMLCGRGGHSDRLIRCGTCGRDYLASQIAAQRAAAAPDAARCKHDMIAAGCADCRPGRPRGHDGPGPALFTARYQGECAGCDETIRPGDMIRRNPGGHGYQCETCATQVTP